MSSEFALVDGWTGILFNRFKFISLIALIWSALASSNNSWRLKRLDSLRMLSKKGRRRNRFIFYLCDDSGGCYLLSPCLWSLFQSYSKSLQLTMGLVQTKTYSSLRRSCQPDAVCDEMRHLVKFVSSAWKNIVGVVSSSWTWLLMNVSRRDESLLSSSSFTSSCFQCFLVTVTGSPRSGSQSYSTAFPPATKTGIRSRQPRVKYHPSDVWCFVFFFHLCFDVFSAWCLNLWLHHEVFHFMLFGSQYIVRQQEYDEIFYRTQRSKVCILIRNPSNSPRGNIGTYVLNLINVFS